MLTPLISFLLIAPVIAIYAPISTTCPSTSLVRDATGLSDDEETYRVARKAIADEALKSWLIRTNSGFGTDELPIIALTTSGGGYRSLLTGAGVIQGLDSRDSDVSTSGIYQALTYHAGLSGGAWLISSLAGNNWPTVSYLKENLWKRAFADSLFDPSFLLAAFSLAEIASDIGEKNAAGFHTTLTDPWGRLLSYQLLQGFDGGVSTTLSSIASLPNFTSHAVPFPIMTSLGAKVWLGECTPGPNATTYELTPYEFGSWGSDVSAFTPTKYLGTSIEGGHATGTCTTNYDNLGYIFGTSSNIFNVICVSVPTTQDSMSSIQEDLAEILDFVHDVTTEDLYATYRNPFYNYISSTATSNIANNISAQESLSLVDGAEALQNNPIFPLLQPSRNISAIIVNDNSDDISTTHFPNGSAILTTYVQSLSHGLTRMPYIPPVETFLSEGLNSRPTFFGCGDDTKITIIYLPNAEFSFNSGTSTAQLIYSETETEEMIANGVQVAAQGGDSGWATCLGCAFMQKTGQALPGDCEACFSSYCYYS